MAGGGSIVACCPSATWREAAPRGQDPTLFPRGRSGVDPDADNRRDRLNVANRRRRTSQSGGELPVARNEQGARADHSEARGVSSLISPSHISLPRKGYMNQRSISIRPERINSKKPKPRYRSVCCMLSRVYSRWPLGVLVPIAFRSRVKARTACSALLLFHGTLS